MNPMNKTVSKTRKRIVIYLDRPTDSQQFCPELFFTITASLLEKNETGGGNLLLSGTA